MEKLIELLNEYEKKERKSEFYEWEKWVWWEFNLFRRDTYDEEWSHIYSDTADTYVISKKFWFIKRLVENDKIDVKELEKSDRPFDVGYATEETLYERVLWHNPFFQDGRHSRAFEKHCACRTHWSHGRMPNSSSWFSC